jgi:hypothetical protein
MRIARTEGTPLSIADRVAELEPDLLLLSHVPPVGLTRARYLIKRLGSRLGNVPLIFGHWEAGADATAVAQSMRSVAANRTVLSVTQAREIILGLVRPETQEIATGPVRERVESA